MGPFASECRLSRFDHMREAWILVRILVHFSFNSSDYGPTTLGSMPEMLLKRIIAIFPSVQALSAKKADAVIRIFGVRFEIESGFRQLRRSC